MTLSGKIAAERPDVDRPRRLLPPVVVHRLVGVRHSQKFKDTRTGLNSDGAVSRVTGTYTARVNRMTEAERRAAGLRRNGRPKR